jgi:hypothetical protein
MLTQKCKDVSGCAETQLFSTIMHDVQAGVAEHACHIRVLYNFCQTKRHWMLQAVKAAKYFDKWACLKVGYITKIAILGGKMMI